MNDETRKNAQEMNYRFISLAGEGSAIDAESRTVKLGFSSEEPVTRNGWEGEWIEILDHSPESANLEFIGAGRAPLLLDHDPRQQIGVVENVTLDASARRTRATVRLGKGALADEVFNDINDKIRQNISVGYRIGDLGKPENVDEDGIPVHRIRDWTPLEISVVSIPADQSDLVGVGRSKQQADEKGRKDEKMETENNELEIRQTETPAQNYVSETEIAAKIRKQNSAIIELAALHNRRDLADFAIREGNSLEEFRGILLDEIGNNKPLETPKSKLDVPEKEAREYSIIRAINAAAANDWRSAGFEKECSETIAKRIGKDPRGFYVPSEAWATRVLTVGSSGSGQELRPTDHLGDEFIAALRARQVISGLGARYMEGLSGDVAIPKFSAGASAAFVAEDSDVQAQTQTTAQVTLSPNTLGAYVDLSRKLLKQSSPSADRIVREDLIAAVADKLEDVAIEGGGNNEPSGITQTNGIGSVAIGANGGSPTWASVVQLAREVEVDNAAINSGTLAFLTNPKVKSELASTAKVSSTDSVMILNDPWDNLYGYPMSITTNVPSDLTKGNGTDLSALIFGDFSQLLIGFWGGLDILVDPYTGGAAGTVRLIIHHDVDVAVRHAQSFAADLDYTTS